jgi:hypothetical protein
MVTFIVDKDEVKQTFMVHKAVAAFHSSFFKAAFESKMIEGQTQTMRLEDVEGNIFGLLNSWLYTEKIDPSIFQFREHLHTLCKLWELARRCLIPKLQHAVIIRIDDITSSASESWEMCEILLPLAELWRWAQNCEIKEMQQSISTKIQDILSKDEPELDEIKDFVVYAFECSESKTLKRLAVFAIKMAVRKHLESGEYALSNLCKEIPPSAWHLVTMQLAQCSLHKTPRNARACWTYEHSGFMLEGAVAEEF